MTAAAPADPIRTPAPRCHVDGDHHALEVDEVFSRTRQYACHPAFDPEDTP